MANKKKIEQRMRVVQRRRTERIIQIAGIVILFLIVVGIVWLVLPGESSNVLELPAGLSKQYDAAPALVIDTNRKYFATFKLAKGGEFVAELYADKAPVTVNNFVFLSREGFYEGVMFHRVISNFMAQGGDPTGTGTGGPGYTIKCETQKNTHKHVAGTLSMAHAGKDTGGSQFFICHSPQRHLDGVHTVFGQVTKGMDVVNAIRGNDEIKSIRVS